jgi:hypothetical protein
VCNETLPVIAMRVSNPYYSPLACHSRNAAPTPSCFAEIISDRLFPNTSRSKVFRRFAGDFKLWEISAKR